MKVRKTRHAVFNIHYHLVWCPKHRKKVLVGETKLLVENTIEEVCALRGWFIEEMSVQPDHVHVFLSAAPIFSPMFIVKVLKGNTGIRAVKERRYAGRFWSPSYYVGTAGTVTQLTIQKYIQEQKHTEE